MKWMFISAGLLFLVLTGMITFSSAVRPSVLRSINDIAASDELFYADQYMQTLTPVSDRLHVVRLPHISHMAMASDPAALQVLIDNL